MAIVTDEDVHTEETTAVGIPVRKFRTQEELGTTLLFDKEAPLDTIIQYVEGSKWTVDFFTQLRGLSDELHTPDTNIPATTQKYHRINKLILHVQTALTQDTLQNITGEVIINAGFMPNAHDAFIATLTGGRIGIFVLTEVEARTYNLHPAYYAQFKLFAFADTEVIIYNDIVNKTVKEYTYDKDHLLDYSAPIILATDYKKKIDLKKMIPELTEYYFTKFIEPTRHVIAPPTTSSIFVDTLLSDFLFKIIDLDDSNRINDVSRLDVDLSEIIDFTIWDVILSRRLDLLKRAKQNIGFKYNPSTVADVATRHISYLGINFLATILPAGTTATAPDYVNIAEPRDSTYVAPILAKDSSYVLSSNFYNNTPTTCGPFEKAVLQYLRGELQDTNELDKLLGSYFLWDTIDQYYLIPILIVLVKDSVNNTFRSI